MYLNSTPCTDGFNRQVHIRNKNSHVTNCIWLFKAFDFLRQSGGYDIIKSVIAPTLPYKKCRGGRTQFGNFIQRLAGIQIGKEDLNDHDTIDDDPAFLSAVGLSAASGCATPSNFENSLQRHTLTAMQQNERRALERHRFRVCLTRTEHRRQGCASCPRADIVTALALCGRRCRNPVVHDDDPLDAVRLGLEKDGRDPAFKAHPDRLQGGITVTVDGLAPEERVMLGNGVTRFVDMGAPCGDDVALDEESEHDFAKKQRMHRSRRLRNAKELRTDVREGCADGFGDRLHFIVHDGRNPTHGEDVIHRAVDLRHDRARLDETTGDEPGIV